MAIKPEQVTQLCGLLQCTQRQLAYFLGVSNFTVTRWVSGETEVKGTSMLVIRGLLNALNGNERNILYARKHCVWSFDHILEFLFKGLTDEKND